MHPLNRLLATFNLAISRPNKFSAGFKKQFYQRLRELRQTANGFRVFPEPYDDAGEHPQSYIDHECGFATKRLNQSKPQQLLDIGSYRHYILGLLSHYPVTTIDVRPRPPASVNETVITADAKALGLPDSSFDAVISLCALEHFGLGRYGDDFDLDADKKALAEMIRVLKPTGQLILTTTITRAGAGLAFNAHRIYSLEMIRELCAGMKCLEEDFFSNRLNRSCTHEEVTADPSSWDVYLGCWERQ
jgi:SAM-dependent methyltransferase